jgi:cardiolipin synthase
MPDLLPYLVTALSALAAAGAAGHAAVYKRDSRAAMLWITLIVFLPLAGAALYFILGINRVHRRAVILRRRALRRHSLPASPPDPPPCGEPALPPALGHLAPLARAVGDLTARPLLAGNRLEPLLNGDAAYPAMLAQIAAAKHSISLSTYIFNADETGMSFVTALGDAVRRGVQVRVLIDASNTLFAKSAVYRALRTAGVPYARFMPLFMQWPPVTLNLRNHRKLLLVDGRLGFTGGMNILASHWLGKRPLHPVADIQFRVEGPVVAHLQDAFADDWLFATGEILEGGDWFPPLAPAGETPARGIASGPDQHLETLRWSLLAAIATAQRSLRILTPYFVPDPPLVSALNVARRRGVAVEIVLPDHGDVPFVQWASAAQWWQVLEHGCRIWRAPPPFDHAKLFVVDDEWALVGSANWDPRSLRLNFEFCLECYDPAFARTLTGIFEARRRGAREITLAEADGRSLPVRLRDGICRLASPFM